MDPDDSDLALEAAIGKIASGDESSGSDRETETPPPAVSDSESAVYGGASFQQGERGGCERQPPPMMLIPRSQVTLNVLLSDSRLFMMFRLFLKDQCITRNLTFWLACEHYRKLPSGAPEHQDQLLKVAKAIYVKYIKMSAPQLVQVQSSTKRTIKSIVGLSPRTLSPSLFKPAQDEVWTMMQQNELRQFLASDTFGDVFCEDDQSSEMVYTPGVLPVLRGGSLQQSSSEDSVSVTSISTDGGGSELGPTRSSCLRSFSRHGNSTRACISDSEQPKNRRSHPPGPHATKDKPVTSEDFAAMVSERLMAVQKDRDHMRKRAQEQARQQGRSYEEIIAVNWYDLPEAAKYARFDIPASGSRTDSLHLPPDKRGFSHNLSPSHSPSLAPYPNPNTNQHSKMHIDTLAQREIQDALKDLEITNQVSRNRRHYHMTHPNKPSSATSSILSYTSDSGVGDSAQWTTASSIVASNRYVQRFVEGQNHLINQTPQRDMEATAAAIALMSNSPHPEALSHRVPHSLGSSSSRHRRDTNPHQLVRNYTGAYSSDDNASFLTITSESDLFIPRRRYPHHAYSESDEPHQPSRYHRVISRPKKTQLRHAQPSHQTPPIVEPSHTPLSQARIPQPSTPSMSQKSTSSSGILVLYDLVDISAPNSNHPPFAKRHHASHVTLADFKQKIFSRKGDYRFFFKSFCEDIADAIMEEISDDEVVLPHYEGKIIARVEKVA